MQQKQVKRETGPARPIHPANRLLPEIGYPHLARPVREVLIFVDRKPVKLNPIRLASIDRYLKKTKKPPS